MKSVRFFDPKNEINFVKYFRPMLVVAAIIPLLAILVPAIPGVGINWGIDFQGGTEMQVLFTKDLPNEEIIDVLVDAGFTKHQVQRYGSAGSMERLIRVERLATFTPEAIAQIESLLSKTYPAVGDVKPKVRFNAEVGDRLTISLPEPQVADANNAEMINLALSTQRSGLAYLLDSQSGYKLRQTKDVSGELSMMGSVKQDDPKDGMVTYSVLFTGVSDKIESALSSKFGKVEVRRVGFVDSNVSQQLRTDGALAILFALIAILIYIGIRFDFFFAPGAIIALIQDTFGAFLVFVFFRYEFDLPSVAALLTVLGVSINNTIVVYDRIRETVPSTGKRAPDESHVVAAVNKAINDTLSRTINTTLTLVIASLCLWWFAGGVIESFAMVLTVGLALGAVSSTFAAPAIYLFMRRKFGHLGEAVTQTEQGRSREDKARGVV